MTDIRRVFLDVGPIKNNILEIPQSNSAAEVPLVLGTSSTQTVQSSSNLIIPIVVIAIIITAVLYYHYDERKKMARKH